MQLNMHEASFLKRDSRKVAEKYVINNNYNKFRYISMTNFKQ